MFGGFSATISPVLVATTGCSVKRFAINRLGDSLANSGTTYAADDDPELVGQALPFSLKLVEGLLAESPRHRGLLLTAASGVFLTATSWQPRPTPESLSIR